MSKQLQKHDLPGCEHRKKVVMMLSWNKMGMYQQLLLLFCENKPSYKTDRLARPIEKKQNKTNNSFVLKLIFAIKATFPQKPFQQHSHLLQVSGGMQVDCVLTAGASVLHVLKSAQLRVTLEAACAGVGCVCVCVCALDQTVCTCSCGFQCVCECHVHIQFNVKGEEVSC